MTATTVFLTSLAMMCLSAAPATTQSTVTVTMKPANILKRFFDPQKPPAGVPLDPDIEAACSAASFSCHSDMDLAVLSETPSSAGTELTAQIKAIRVTLCLDDTLWLPEGASEKLTAHEQGHADISRKFFDKSQTTVETTAKNLVGQTVKADGKDHQAALEAIARKVNSKISRTYTRETTTASAAVQVAYDKLTDHSRNKVAEDTAITLAMKHAGAPAATQPIN